MRCDLFYTTVFDADCASLSGPLVCVGLFSAHCMFSGVVDIRAVTDIAVCPFSPRCLMRAVWRLRELIRQLGWFPLLPFSLVGCRLRFDPCLTLCNACFMWTGVFSGSTDPYVISAA